MELTYPMTREQLLNYRETYHKIENDKRTICVVDDISRKILHAGFDKNTHCEVEFNKVSHTTEDGVSREVYDFERGWFQCDQRYFDEVIVGKLKTRFPDCTFTQDPEKKYLFVDWS